ncbi:MAG TPA: ABC transporter permease subunit [Planctomycetota bacterium]|nr:ABC transporter permease subunit [Planctomycetota bacterium]
MSRPLVTVLAALFALAALAPIAVMLARIGSGDLAGLFDARTFTLLGRTVVYGVASAALALALGVPFGFLVARTDLPGASFLRPLGLVPLLLPPMLLAMTWTVLIDLRGAPAAILVSGAATFPLVALFVARSAERIDGRIEEAALLAGGLRAVLRVDLPLVAPAALCAACIAFVFTVNDFSVPDYVSWVGPKFNVYADEIFATWRQHSEPGRAVATALPLIALTLASLLPALALRRRRGALAVQGGDFRSPEPLRLGALRWPALGFAALLVILAAGVPLARLVWEAGGGQRGWSADGFRSAMGRALERSRGDLANSLVYSALAASACVVLGLGLGHAIERARRGRWLEPLALLPIAVPAVLFGIGIVVCWNHDWSARFYDGGGLVVLLYVGRYAAFPILVMSGAVAMLDRSLEESAQLAGVRPARRLARIVAPLLRPALLGGWILVFVFAMRELDAAILVPAANHTAMFRIFNQVHFGRDDFVAALALLLVFLILLPGILWSLFGRRRLELLP